MADAMASGGMKDVGYEYIIIDDCWMTKERSKDGRFVEDSTRFPSGIKALADYVHSKGLKFGIYSDAGTKTCAGYPGSRGYEFIDAQTFADWGVDYLKYDWCYHGEQLSKPSYSTMRDALYKTGRPMILSICEWGSTQPWTWAKDIGHLWRTTSDIIDCFDCKANWGGLGVLQIIDEQVPLRKYSGPGHWNDMDMLEVGNEGLTLSECRTHFSFWNLMSSPIIAGNDLRTMSKEIKTILTNKEMIEIGQDPLGIAAMRWMDYGDFEVWFKPLENDNFAVAFLNRSDDPYPLEYNLLNKVAFDLEMGRKSYKVTNAYMMRDVWKHKDLGNTKQTIKTVLDPHDILVLKLYKHSK